MGTSKIILLSGVYMVLGLYTVSFISADESNFSNALQVSSTLQSEQIAKSGLALALAGLGNDISKTSIPASEVTISGGVLSYSASRPASFPLTQTQVVSTGQFNGEQVQMTAVFHFQGGRWKVLRVYTVTLA